MIFFSRFFAAIHNAWLGPNGVRDGSTWTLIFGFMAMCTCYPIFFASHALWALIIAGAATAVVVITIIRIIITMKNHRDFI